jgi:hypothetical protein
MKLKMVARFWWNCTDMRKPNYAIVVYFTMVWLRIQVFWDVMLDLWVSDSK